MLLLCCAIVWRSVIFNYLNRDFFNALAEKDVDRFQLQLVKYLVAFAFGEPGAVVWSVVCLWCVRLTAGCVVLLAVQSAAGRPCLSSLSYPCCVFEAGGAN